MKIRRADRGHIGNTGTRSGSAEEAAIRDLGPEGDDNFSGSGPHIQNADGDYSQRPVD